MSKEEAIKEALRICEDVAIRYGTPQFDKLVEILMEEETTPQGDE